MNTPASATEALQHLAAADASRAQRVVALWARPSIPDSEIHVALGVPPSVWAQCKADGDTPPLFTIGRRLFARTTDLRAWLDRKADGGKPGSKRLRAKTADIEEAAR